MDGAILLPATGGHFGATEANSHRPKRQIQRTIGKLLVGVSAAAALAGLVTTVAEQSPETSTPGVTAMPNQFPTTSPDALVTIGPSPEAKPNVSTVQPFVEQLITSDVLTPYNVETGEGTISYATLQQARSLHIELTPRVLNGLTKYVQGYNAIAHRVLGEPALDPSALPVGYRVFRPSDKMLLAKAQHLIDEASN